SDKGVIAALVRGDHEINMVKLKNYLKAEWIELADEATVEKVTNAPKGFAGPVGLDIRIIADHAIGSLSNFVTGANEADAHFINVNYDRDFPLKEITDLRFITPSDRCPECGGEILNLAQNILKQCTPRIWMLKGRKSSWLWDVME
ncbi:MAG: hypothetical protein JRI44_08255, partial [Deltaproteobacteria bacterium]|nr:hypothetical protein [Deltaproteobacteria bacterium]